MLREGVTRGHNLMPFSRARRRANSDSGQPSRLWFICGTLILMSCSNLAAQTWSIQPQLITARISVVSLTPPRVRVEAERAEGTRAWSFRNAYAGINGLGERIENLSLSDARGVEIAARKLAAGEYDAAREATKISYELKLDPPRGTNDTAHVSWLTATRGVLMPGDLLPLPSARARLSLTLPGQWKVATVETRNGGGQYEIEDAESSIFFVGDDVRQTEKSVSGMDFTFATAGEWAFADGDVIGIVRDIIERHARINGSVPRKRALIVLAPFPQTADASRWSAETRGATVFFLAGRSPSKAAGLARLSVPLAHEIFHLWVPNALSLSGDYAWFYEGFTVYQSTRVSVELGYLTFQDYLDSLARAADNYLAQREQDKYSLIEASTRRWGGSGSLIYHKGMLTAALYDLTVRRSSRGRRSLDDVYRALFRQHRASVERPDGNAAVIAALNSIAGGSDFSKRHIESASPLDLTVALPPFGLKVQRNGASTRISLDDSISRPQRDLLRQMGYN
jgi:predicted metalloprotease with PDZ domain